MAAKAAGRLRDYIALVDKVIRILIVYGKIKRIALAAPGRQITIVPNGSGGTWIARLYETN